MLSVLLNPDVFGRELREVPYLSFPTSSQCEPEGNVDELITGWFRYDLHKWIIQTCTDDAFWVINFSFSINI